jgi:phage gp29-like protein
MFKLFARRPAATQELARQLTLFDRRAQEIPGHAPGPLPYATYDLMQRDSMVQTVLNVKRQGVLAARFRIAAANDSASARRNALFVQENLERMEGSATSILSQAMDAFAKGWSVQETVFEAVGDVLMLRAVRAKNPANFGLRLDDFGQIQSLTLDQSLAPVPPTGRRGLGEEGRALPRWKFVIYANRSAYGKPRGVSDLDAAHPHWKAKTTLLEAWRLHLEKFASPVVLGKYERGLPPEEAASLLAALDGLARRNAIVFPNEIEVGTLGSGRESNTGFMDAIEFHNREIARSVLGQTLTTDEGRRVGSLALGKVHLQVLLLQLQALRRELADSVIVEQVFRPLIELNFGPGDIPRFEFEDVPLDAFVAGSL